MRKLFLLFLLTTTFTSCTKEELIEDIIPIDNSAWYEYEFEYTATVRMEDGSVNENYKRKAKHYFFFDGTRITKWVRNTGQAMKYQRHWDSTTYKKFYTNNAADCDRQTYWFTFDWGIINNDTTLTITGGEELSKLYCEGCDQTGSTKNQWQIINDGTIVAKKLISLSGCTATKNSKY